MGKDTKTKIPRINLFQQMKLFFEIAEENPDISQTEIALYFFLLYLNNNLTWREWFSLSISQATGGARLSEKTFYKAINILESQKLIERRKGHKTQAGQIKIVILKAVNFTVCAPFDGELTGNCAPFDGELTGNCAPTFIDSKDNKDLKEKKDYLYIANLFFTSELKKGKAALKKYQDENPYSDKDKIPHEYQTPFKERMKRGNQLQEYEKFVKYLNGENQLKKPLEGILSIPGQLTLGQFATIGNKHYPSPSGLKRSKETNLPKTLTDMIDQINNTEKYHKGKKELFPILQNWKSFSVSGQTPPDNKPAYQTPKVTF